MHIDSVKRGGVYSLANAPNNHKSLEISTYGRCISDIVTRLKCRGGTPRLLVYENLVIIVGCVTADDDFHPILRHLRLASAFTALHVVFPYNVCCFNTMVPDHTPLSGNYYLLS